MSKYDKPLELMLDGTRLMERGYTRLLEALEMREDPEAREAVEAALRIARQFTRRMEEAYASLPKPRCSTPSSPG